MVAKHYVKMSLQLYQVHSIYLLSNFEWNSLAAAFY